MYQPVSEVSIIQSYPWNLRIMKSNFLCQVQSEFNDPKWVKFELTITMEICILLIVFFEDFFVRTSNNRVWTVIVRNKSLVLLKILSKLIFCQAQKKIFQKIIFEMFLQDSNFFFGRQSNQNNGWILGWLEKLKILDFSRKMVVIV